MNHTLVIVTREDEQAIYTERVKRLDLPNLEILTPETDRDIRQAIQHATIMLAHPGLARPYVNDATNLRWMQSTFAGVDALIAPELRTDYLLTNVKDTYGAVMTEWVFAYILLFEREVLENIKAQSKREWAHHPYSSVAEKTLGILGTGSIGRHIARVARAFSMKTIGLNSSGTPVDEFDEIFSTTQRHNLLQQADYVINVLPSTAETRGSLDLQFFESFLPHAVFMNIGRGDAVVEADLLTALRRNLIRAAVLDVFGTEPLPRDNPLWNEPHVYLTPHVSGYTISEQIFSIFAENYRRYIAGERLQYRVDFTKGY